jgi:hypothetical protein
MRWNCKFGLCELAACLPFVVFYTIMHFAAFAALTHPIFAGCLAPDSGIELYSRIREPRRHETMVENPGYQPA